jgi:uncharacterized OB-fold protein
MTTFHSAGSETTPVVDGLFQGQGGSTRLLASRCRGCGSVYFPRSLSCRHPHCADKHPQDILLGPRGTLYSVTVQTYRPPALFVMDDWKPYALGLVDLPEGIRVMAMLCGRSPQDWRIGEAVALTTGALSRDTQGREVLTYQFQPLEASRACDGAST